ncbi:hypothetical protein ABIE78_003326 [Sinorhizobium fredii]
MPSSTVLATKSWRQNAAIDHKRAAEYRLIFAGARQRLGLEGDLQCTRCVEEIDFCSPAAEGFPFIDEGVCALVDDVGVPACADNGDPGLVRLYCNGHELVPFRSRAALPHATETRWPGFQAAASPARIAKAPWMTWVARIFN